MKPVMFFDTESYPNYWILCIRAEGSTQVRTFKAPLRYLDTVEIQRIFNQSCMISFNGIHYDIPMIKGAMCGMLPLELHQLTQKIIVEKIRPHLLNLPEWAPADHIDIMNVIPGNASLKQYAARIHYPDIQELPYPPGTLLTQEQQYEVLAYCGSDLNLTEALYHELKPELKLREEMGKSEGLDLRSKSNAQITETLYKTKCGVKKFNPKPPQAYEFYYQRPAYLQTGNPSLLSICEHLNRSPFRVGYEGRLSGPECLQSPVIIKETLYKMGIGGLHSKEQNCYYQIKDGEFLREYDVHSYYPSLILNSGKYPPALGPIFPKIYRRELEKRLAAKAKQATLSPDHPEYAYTMALNEGGKIMLNAPFGKMNSWYSALYSPEMFIHTTLTGQLSLLMLIEWLSMTPCEVVSANTDGVVIKGHPVYEGELESLINLWQTTTNLTLGKTDYKGLFIKDVSNYIGVKINNTAKRKGVYGKAGLIAMKNPHAEICADAISAFLTNGVPIRTTIGTCTNFKKFLVVRKVEGGAEVLEGFWNKTKKGWVSGESSTRKPIGGVVRWYYGKGKTLPLICSRNGYKVGDSEGAVPVVIMRGDIPEDLDIERYVQRAEKLYATFYKKGNV